MRSNSSLSLLIIAALASACDGADVSSHGKAQQAFLVDQSKAVLPTDVTLHDALEAETIEKIRARLGHKELAAFEETLADPLAGRIWRVRGDEELNRLLSTLYALQDAPRATAHREGLRGGTRHRSIEVDIALVESLGREDVFARVVRAEGLQGRNLVQVTQDGLTPERVAMAFESLSRLRRTYGDFLTRRQTVLLRNDLRLGPQGSVHLTRALEVVRRIKGAERQTLRGDERAPRITITLPPES